MSVWPRFSNFFWHAALLTRSRFCSTYWSLTAELYFCNKLLISMATLKDVINQFLNQHLHLHLHQELWILIPSHHNKLQLKWWNVLTISLVVTAKVNMNMTITDIKNHVLSKHITNPFINTVQTVTKNKSSGVESDGMTHRLQRTLRLSTQGVPSTKWATRTPRGQPPIFFLSKT